MKQEITFLIQARLGSTRLPKKVLSPLYKKTLLENIYRRINLESTIILTSNTSVDDDLEQFCIDSNMKVYRGSEDNVFERFLSVVKTLNTPYFARITGDNPFVEVSEYQKMLQLMKKDKLDRILNIDVPLGCSFEILTKDSFLKQAQDEIDDFQKEHVTSGYYQNQDIYRCGVYRHQFKSISNLRLTVDEPLDLKLVRAICSYFSKDACDISLKDIETLYKKESDFFQINLQVKQKNT